MKRLVTSPATFSVVQDETLKKEAVALTATLRPAKVEVSAGRATLPSAPGTLDRWLLIALGLVALPRAARSNL